jgi:hypothetical protein
MYTDLLKNENIHIHLLKRQQYKYGTWEKAKDGAYN